MQLRPYQQDGINAVRNELRNGKKSVLFILGCGGGKSIIQGSIARMATNKGNRVLFLVHRKELCEQIRQTFELVGVNMDLCDICMVQTASRRLKNLCKPNLIITDEAHHSLANSYMNIYVYFPNATKIGFTATPIRLDGRGLGRIYESMVQSVSTRWLIDNHYLAPYVAYGLDLIDTDKLHRRAGDYVLSEIDEIFGKKIYGGVTGHWLKFAEGKQTIVYCATVNASKNIAINFRSLGIKAEHLDGSTPKAERERIIEGFRKGEVKVLSNVDLFGEGFDVPDCECVMLLRPTLSLSLHIQQSMRSMRYKEGKTAIIIDHVGNIARHGFPDDVYDWSLEDKEKELIAKKGASTVKARQCSNCYMMSPASYKVCPYCNHEFVKTKAELQQEEAELVELRRKELKEAPYEKVYELVTFEEIEEFRQAREYKFAWTIRQCLDRNIPIPKKYNGLVYKIRMGKW